MLDANTLTHQVRIHHPGGVLPDVVSEPLDQEIAEIVARRLPARFADMHGREIIAERRCDKLVGCIRGAEHDGGCITR